MQTKKAAFERFVRLTSSLISSILPHLHRVETLILVKLLELCQDRWGQVPIHVGRLAASIHRDASQTRRSLRSLADLGIFALEPGERPGTYAVLCAQSPEAWKAIAAKVLERAQRPPTRAAQGEEGPALHLSPPPPPSALPRRPPKRRRSGKGGGGDDQGPGLFQGGPGSPVDPTAPTDPPPPPAAPTVPSPAPTEPTPPPSSPEPYGYPPADAARPATSRPDLRLPVEGLETLDFTDVFFAPKRTFSPAATGEKVRNATPPILMNSLDREISKNSLRSSDASAPAPARPSAPAALPSAPRLATLPPAQDDEGDDDETIDDDFFEEGDESGDLEDEGEQPFPVGAAPLEDLALVWAWVGPQLPDLGRPQGIRLLTTILAFCGTYNNVRAYLGAELPRVIGDPHVRYPLSYLAHEPRYHQWRERHQRSTAGPAAGPGGAVLAFRRPPGSPAPLGAAIGAVLADVAPHASNAPKAPPPPAPPAPPTPPAYLLDPGYVARQAAQGARNVSGARGVLATLTPPPERLPLEAIEGPGLYATHRGYRYQRGADGWTRIGPVRG